MNEVTPLSFKQINKAAMILRKGYGGLDLAWDAETWIDDVLPSFDIKVLHDPDLSEGDEGLMVANLNGSTFIHLKYFECLFVHSRDTNRARATLAHEIGHVFFHAEQNRLFQRKILKDPSMFASMARSKKKIDSYRNPEWQAWAFAGCFLMPPDVIKGMPPYQVSIKFEVSFSFAEYHIGRCKRLLWK